LDTVDSEAGQNFSKVGPEMLDIVQNRQMPRVKN
jgi:hypothetical protein